MWIVPFCTSRYSLLVSILLSASQKGLSVNVLETIKQLIGILLWLTFFSLPSPDPEIARSLLESALFYFSCMCLRNCQSLFRLEREMNHYNNLKFLLCSKSLLKWGKYLDLKAGVGIVPEGSLMRRNGQVHKGSEDSNTFLSEPEFSALTQNSICS